MIVLIEFHLCQKQDIHNSKKSKSTEDFKFNNGSMKISVWIYLDAWSAVWYLI